MSVNYLELLNRFWELNRVHRFTPSECNFYFYLLNECNRNYWRMPVACPSSIVCAVIGMPKATLMRARKGLQERGLIRYEEGTQNSRSPTYTVLQPATACETAHATAYGLARETACETVYKDKEENKEMDSSHRVRMQSIDVLETRLMGDEEWQGLVMRQLTACNLCLPKEKSLTDYIRQFFGYLRLCNIREKEDADCRCHFFNKLRKEYLKPNDYATSKQDLYSGRRGVEVSASSPTDYEGAF